MQLILVILSSLLWGITNPFIRKGASGLEKIQADNFISKTFLELRYLFTNFNVNFTNDLNFYIFLSNLVFGPIFAQPTRFNSFLYCSCIR